MIEEMDKTVEVRGTGINIAIKGMAIAADVGRTPKEKSMSCVETLRSLDAVIVVRTADGMDSFNDAKLRKVRSQCEMKDFQSIDTSTGRENVGSAMKKEDKWL